MNVRYALAGLLSVLLISGPATAAPDPAVTVDGAKVGQVIDGFGVNVNHRSWNAQELPPVLDKLIDQAGMTLFRVVFDNADWEAANDNSDPAVMNRAYYDSLYASARFEPLWDTFAYLNSRGLSDGIFFNFMGPGPVWMGGDTLGDGMSAEWAEQIASLYLYARNKRGLKFHLAAPNNEPDIQNEGIHMDSLQYVEALHALVLLLDRNGLGDLRFVAPDRAGGGTNYLPELVKDPVIMAKLAHFGVHSYSDNGGGSRGVYDFIQHSVYPDRTFWMTEFNVWLPNADNGQRGAYDWPFCRGTARYLMKHLANGASAGIVWEGYDSYYTHPPACWSFWGLVELKDENATPKVYVPRKNFYTVAQISRFVRPGAHRLEMPDSAGTFSPLLAFYHDKLGQLTLVGLNTASTPAGLRVKLESLPSVKSLDLYYTSRTVSLEHAGRVSVTDGEFRVTLPADCVFTLSSPTK